MHIQGSSSAGYIGYVSPHLWYILNSPGLAFRFLDEVVLPALDTTFIPFLSLLEAVLPALDTTPVPFLSLSEVVLPALNDFGITSLDS